MFNFFKKAISVTFIDDSTGYVIDESDIKQEYLPESFDKPTTFELSGKQWVVVKADPVHAMEYSLSKKLTIHLRPVEQMNPKNIRFSLPTLSNELPATEDKRVFHDFILELHEDNWRQIEFLPHKLLPGIQKEMEAVEAILFPEDESTVANGYETIHVRKLGRHNLSISFSDFCEQVKVLEKGAFTFTNHPGYVKDGFALRTANYTYYGTLEGDTIKELCLEDFESVDDEFARIAFRYGLVLVVWCKGQITTV
jgi:hypothetical protein